MHPALVPVVDRRAPAGPEQWDALWQALADGALDRGDALALLASLTAALPEEDSLLAMVDALDRRRPARPATPWAGTVNVVGTGGGPPTVNLSTAAALVAAACGVGSSSPAPAPIPRVPVRSTSWTGWAPRSPPRSTRHPVTWTPTASPSPDRSSTRSNWPELALLAVPTPMRVFGRFLNTLGPFLAAVPVSAQVTGVSGGQGPARPAGPRVPARQPGHVAGHQPAGRRRTAQHVRQHDPPPRRRYTHAPRGRTRPRRRNPRRSGTRPREAAAEHFRSVLTGRAGRAPCAPPCNSTRRRSPWPPDTATTGRRRSPRRARRSTTGRRSTWWSG